MIPVPLTSAKELLSDKCAYFFEQGNYEALVKALIEIHNDLDGLAQRRKESFEEHFKYTTESFLRFLEKYELFKGYND